MLGLERATPSYLKVAHPVMNHYTIQTFPVQPQNFAPFFVSKLDPHSHMADPHLWIPFGFAGESGERAVLHRLRLPEDGSLSVSAMVTVAGSTTIRGRGSILSQQVWTNKYSIEQLRGNEVSYR